LTTLKEPYSLPSGHSGFAMLVAWVFWPYCLRRWRFVLALCVVWVGISRISVGAHFPADVLAGYLCGGLSAWLATGVCQTSCRVTLNKITSIRQSPAGGIVAAGDDPARRSYMPPRYAGARPERATSPALGSNRPGPGGSCVRPRLARFALRHRHRGLYAASFSCSDSSRSGFNQTSSFNSQFLVCPDQRPGCRVLASA
jgi:hypothetical protein